jgi:hypothetical protein
MWTYGPRRQPRKGRDNKPARIPAAIAMMAREREDLPFGVVGEFSAPQPSAPPPPPPKPFVIPPSPEEERREALQGAESEPPPPAPLGDALAELKARGGEDFPELRLDPPETVASLLRPRLPAPDWRAEERERARKPRRNDEPTKSLQRWPA